MSDQKTIASLVAQLSLDSAQFRKELDDTKRRMGDLDRKAKETRDRFNSLERQMNDSAAMIKGTMVTALGALGVSLSVGKVIDYSESWTTLDNRLKLVSKTNDQLLKSQAAVIQIANDARVPINSTADLYAKLTKAGETLGLTQQRVGVITETIAKSLAISGGSVESQNAAIMQLNQALASGVLRGEEFNSISEQAPRLLYAMADALGVNIGELRNMAQDGQLTADVVVKALESQSAAIRSEFGQMAPTIGQSVTLIENSMIQMIGKMDSASGFSQKLSGFIATLAGQIGAVGDSSASAQEKAGILTDVIKISGFIVQGVSAGFESLGSNIGAWAAQVMQIKDFLSGDQDWEATKRGIANIQEYNAEFQKSLDMRLEKYVASMEGIRVADATNQQQRVQAEIVANQNIITARASHEDAKLQQEAEAAEKRRLAQEQRETDRFVREWEREQVQREEKFTRLEEQHMSDMETLNARREEELGIIAYWESMHTGEKERAEEMRRRVALKYAAEREKIEKENATKSMRYDQMTAQQRIQWHQRMSTALIAIGGSGAEKLFKLNQGLAMAQAAVALPTAVMESFKNGGGYPWGLIPAGLMLVEGLAQINTIRSQKFDSGGSVSTPSIGGGSVGATVPGAPLDNVSQFYEPDAQQGNNKLEISISMTDFSDDAILTGKQVNGLIEQINEALKERNQSISGVR